MASNSFTCEGPDEYACKIMTTNNKNPRESITKWKLAYEIAKLVWRYEEIIKVNAVFPFINSLSDVRLGRPNRVAPM